MTAKLSFRKWITLEEHKKKIQEATEAGDFPDRVFAYLSVASVDFKETDSWENSVFLFIEGVKKFRITNNIPMLSPSPNIKDKKPDAWDYEGRSWSFWSNIFARTYGWTLEYIAELDVNEAFSLAQEILTDEQLSREWTYSLSELAYPYNKSTKKSVYKPMPRPYWMKPDMPEIKKYRFPRNLLPVGAIEDISGMPSELNPLRDYVQKKKETNPSPSP